MGAGGGRERRRREGSKLVPIVWVLVYENDLKAFSKRGERVEFAADRVRFGA